MANDREGITATVAQGDDKARLLKRVLEAEEFWHVLETARARTCLASDQVPILIKPDFAYFDFKGPTGTDPELVEHLIDLLCDRGFSLVAVGAAGDSTMRWLENRDPLTLADLAGYRFATRRGRPYMVVDLSEDLDEVHWPSGSVLHGSGLSRHWTQAAVRISFAKNKTDASQAYAVTLQNLLGILPEQDKDYHYERRWPPEEVCLDLLRTCPPHFCLVDAWSSNHGSAGSRVMNPIQTRTLIASKDALLTDWVAALKMDVDPHASRLTSRAIEFLGLPAGHRIRGDLTPYPDWINVQPVLRTAMQQPIDFAPMGRFEPRWTQWVNRELFPFKDHFDDRANSFFANALGPDANPLLWWAAVWTNYAIAAAGQAIESFAILYDKDRLQRKERPLGIDPYQFTAGDFEAVAQYMEPLEHEIKDVEGDEQGLAWRYLEKSVLFRSVRTIPVPFQEFVARIDISHAIGYMNDYIGGIRVPIKWDERGRVTHQCERNIYLPQPNYLVLSGGKEIDVTKIELIRYSLDEHKIYWKTVKSENLSAIHDDGSVAFCRDGAGTRVVVSGLQEFTLPLFWQVLDLDRITPVKDYLVAHAYRTFFSQTMANFEAAWEGREFRIGQPWQASSPDAGPFSAELRQKAIEKLDHVAKAAQDAFAEVKAVVPFLGRPKFPAGGELDEQGFHHFSSQPAETPGNNFAAIMKRAAGRVSEILVDLAKAAAKDLGVKGGE